MPTSRLQDNPSQHQYTVCPTLGIDSIIYNLKEGSNYFVANPDLYSCTGYSVLNLVFKLVFMFDNGVAYRASLRLDIPPMVFQPEKIDSRRFV